jgi:prepilin-type processing-associated H-X9-DG protein
MFLCPTDITPEIAVAVNDASGNQLALAAPSSYAACVGGDESAPSDATGWGIFYRNSRIRMADITDGTSKTIMVGERAWSNSKGIWAGAVNKGVIERGPLNPCPNIGAANYPAAVLVQAHAHLNSATTDADGGLDDFGSKHAEGANFVFADGSVHFLESVPGDNPDGSYTAECLIFQALGSRAHGEMIPSDWVQ